MESETAKKQFCTDLHRVYYNREIKRGTFTTPTIQDLTKPNKTINPITDEPPKSNYSANKPIQELYTETDVFSEFISLINEAETNGELQQLSIRITNDAQLSRIEKMRLGQQVTQKSAKVGY